MASPAMIHEIANQLREAVEAHWDGDVIRKRLPTRTDLFSPVDQEIESVIQLFDHVSTTFRHALARLRAHRNLSCTIHKLPVEVLTAVFRLAGERGRALNANLSIASTCSHWRNISVSDPLLWSCIDLTSRYVSPPMRCLEMLLERSRPTPLEFYGSLRPDTWLFDFVFSQASRLKVLRDAVFERPQSDLLGFFDHMSPPQPPLPIIISAPLLQDFGVVFHGWTDTIDSHLPFLDATPNLTTLSLREGRLPWNSQSYHNLVSLSIVNARLFYDLVNEGDILAVFRGAPKLESLELRLGSHWRGPLPDYVQFRSTPQDVELHVERIEMRFLRSLVLETRVEVLLHILSHISMPAHISELQLAFECAQSSMIGVLLDQSTIPTFIFSNLRRMNVQHLQYHPHVMELEADGLGEGD